MADAETAPLVREPDSGIAGREAEDNAIYRQLRQAIAAGHYEPGDRLPAERDLAGRIGTSRAVVRRAIQRLEREGRGLPPVGRGTFVFSPPPPRPMDESSPSRRASPLDVLEARMVLEPGFADLIVARAGAQDFEEMTAALDRMEAAATQQEFRELGYAFHMVLARATRNPLLVHFFEEIVAARIAAGWGRLKGLNRTAEDRRAQVASNRVVVEALMARDAELSRKLLRKHLGQMVARVAFQVDD